MPADFTKSSSLPCDAPRLDQPPRGITMWQEPGGATVIRVRMFSLAAFGVLFLALFWIGLWSPYLLDVRGEVAVKFGHELKIARFDFPLRGFWLLLAPVGFIGGIYFAGWTIYRFFGKCEIRINAGEVRFFKGVGALGWTRRFFTNTTESVGMRVTGHRESGGEDKPICRLFVTMDNGRKIQFPSLETTQEKWLAFALKKLLDSP